MVLANSQRDFQGDLRSAATKVLSNYYKLDMEGNPLESPTTVLENVTTVPRDAATSMSNE